MPGSSNTWSVIAGSSASNVWMINDSGALMRWNGTTLSTARPSQVFAPTGIWVGTDSDVWVARYQSVEHWDGASWSSLSVAYSLTALAGSASNQVWGAGQHGAIVFPRRRRPTEGDGTVGGQRHVEHMHPHLDPRRVLTAQVGLIGPWRRALGCH